MLEVGSSGASSAGGIIRVGFIASKIVQQARKFDIQRVTVASARLSPTLCLVDAPKKERLNAQDMTAVMITEQAPAVPNFRDTEDRIKAALRETTREMLPGPDALSEMDCNVPHDKQITVPARDIARLNLCNAALKAMWALLPNGQGNQLRTVRLSNCRSYTAAAVMRQTNDALGLSNVTLSRLCAAKEALSKGIAVDQHLEVESRQDKFDEAALAVEALERKLLEVIVLRRSATDKVQRRALKVQVAEVRSDLRKAQKALKRREIRLTDACRKAEREAIMELGHAQTAWDKYLRDSDPETQERDLTKRVLAALTFGAGNCAEFSEVAFYLLTHGLCGELPPSTPVYQLELSEIDHNVVLIGELTDNPVVVDGWTLVPTPMRLSEYDFGDLIVKEGQLVDSLAFTIVNEFRAGERIREAFPEAVTQEYRAALIALYEAGAVKQKTSIQECVGDARDGERSGVLCSQASLASAVPIRYVGEGGIAEFQPLFPLARVRELQRVPDTLRAVRS